MSLLCKKYHSIKAETMYPYGPGSYIDLLRCAGDS